MRNERHRGADGRRSLQRHSLSTSHLFEGYGTYLIVLLEHIYNTRTLSLACLLAYLQGKWRKKEPLARPDTHHLFILLLRFFLGRWHWRAG